MLHGAHLPNGTITPEDLALFVRGRFRAAKLMWYHTQDDVWDLAQKGCEHFLVRLPDSTDGQRLKGIGEHARECRAVVERFYEAGVVHFQLDNEPNLLAWGPDRQWEYQWFLSMVVSELQTVLPSDVKLGLPPLAWTALSDEQKASWLKALTNVARRMSFICVNSYYQSKTGNSMLWTQFGGSAQTFHEWMPTKPIMVTEWANSLTQLAEPPPQEEIARYMVAQYPRWLEWAASQPYIHSTYVYLIGGTEDWRGFRIDGAIADAMRAALPSTRKHGPAAYQPHAS